MNQGPTRWWRTSQLGGRIHARTDACEGLSKPNGLCVPVLCPPLSITVAATDEPTVGGLVTAIAAWALGEQFAT